MEVRNLIKPTASVVRISEITKGDVYKRLQDSPYTDTKIVFGVVLDVLNNGEEATLVALEFTPVTYANGDIKAETKVFNGKSEIALFPATVDEYRLALGEAIEAQHAVVDRANRDLMTKRAVLEHMLEMFSSALEAARTLEITQ